MNNGVQLTDPSLLRDKAYIDGQWTAADSGKSFAVTDPATGAEVARVPDLGVEETGGPSTRRPEPTRLAGEDGQGTRRRHAAVVRPDHRGHASKYRNAGQTRVCANRILRAGQVHDAGADKLARAPPASSRSGRACSRACSRGR